MRRITVVLEASDNQSSSRLLKHRSVAILALFVGFGLALFLTLADAWFSEFFSTSLTLFFAGGGFFIANSVGWRRLISRSGAQPAGNPLVYWAMLLLWFVLPLAYVLASDLRYNAQVAHTFMADPSCSSGVLRKLAKQPAVLDRAPATSNSASSVCSVHWTRAAYGFEGLCLQLDDGQTPRYYCLPSIWQLDLFDRRRIHAGDMFVAQTAYGRPSAFLYSGRDVADYVFHPWGQIVKTKDHPDEKFIRNLMATFWPVLIYLFLGSGIAVRIFGSALRVSA